MVCSNAGRHGQYSCWFLPLVTAEEEPDHNAAEEPVNGCCSSWTRSRLVEHKKESEDEVGEYVL